MPARLNPDRAAIALSLACIAHCLALPLVAVGLPFAAALSEAEWVHWVLAILAVIASGTVFVRFPSAQEPNFLIPAGLGVALVVGGLFSESVDVDETIPTVIGGCLIAFAHIRRITTNREAADRTQAT